MSLSSDPIGQEHITLLMAWESEILTGSQVS